MRVIAGLDLESASLTEADDIALDTGEIGRSVLGPDGLLRDHELRLGLPPPDVSALVRVARYAARIAELEPRERFYSRSLACDEWGTAAELLEWRDALVVAGWTGGAIPGGATLLFEVELIDVQ